MTVDPEIDRPGPLGHVWEWFIELHARRRIDGAAGISQPINWSEIRDWSELTETPLASHEIRLLTALDDMFIGEERKERARAEHRARQQSKKARR